MLLSEEASVLPLKSGRDCVSKLADNGITVLCLSWFCKEYQRPTVLQSSVSFNTIELMQDFLISRSVLTYLS